MSISVSLHPENKWEKLEALLWGADGGHVFQLHLIDSKGVDYSIHIHYGEKKDRDEFVRMLKSAILIDMKLEYTKGEGE